MTGNLGQARELVAKGVQHCPKSEDLWLEVVVCDAFDKMGY